MGDDELTREDLINLGELEPDAEQETSEEAPESQETAAPEGEERQEPETEQAAEQDAGSAPEGKDKLQDEPDSVQKRIDRLTWEREENKRKLDLLKRNPDQYYALYPEERPQERETPGRPQEPSRPPTFAEALPMVVKGGTYDGRTLQDLMESDTAVERAAAYDIYNAYVRGLEQQQAEAKGRDAEIQERVTREHDHFVASRARDLFGKDAGTLSADEQTKVEQVFNHILDQMEAKDASGKTWAERNGVYNPDSAYRLMTVNDQIKAGVKAIIDSARKSGPSHIEGKAEGPSSGAGSVYDQLMQMSADKVAERLDRMSDAKVEDFWKKAPPAFLKKYSALASAWV